MIAIDKISEIFENNSQTIFVRLEPADYVTSCHSAEQVINGLDKQFREGLIGLEQSSGNNYEPVFTESVQKVWDEKKNKYIADKAAWCMKYGCD